MKTKINIVSVVDRKKALMWLHTRMNSYGQSIGIPLIDASKLLSKPFPIVLEEEKVDVDWHVQYGRDSAEIESLLKGGKLTILPPVSKCGLEMAVVHEIDPQDREMLTLKLAALKECEEACAWYEAQPEDIKRKIALLTRASAPTA